jgi:hypothetical protein
VGQARQVELLKDHAAPSSLAARLLRLRNDPQKGESLHPTLLTARRQLPS